MFGILKHLVHMCFYPLCKSVDLLLCLNRFFHKSCKKVSHEMKIAQKCLHRPKKVYLESHF